MMSRDKLLALKKAARRKTAGMELPIATMHALIDSNLEALDRLEGGTSTQERRAELAERERQVGLALRDLEVSIRTEGASTAKQLYILDMINDMLKATGPKWHREWSWYTPRIEEEFGA
jgi:hypothetical protein